MRKIAIIGLGYAGLHTALAFGKHQKIIGYDINRARVTELVKHKDIHNDFTKKELKDTLAQFTYDESALKTANFYIIIVPTPVNQAKEPDLIPLVSASTLVGKYLKKGDIVVYESTVYPGATEEICVPVLEAKSGLTLGKDFSLGYSPERINPGDKIHKFEDTIKIVAGSDAKTLEIIAKEYENAVDAGVLRVSSIKVAESAKAIENAQRDLNIAFVNEIAVLLHALGLDTSEVLNAALTKWNFLPFKPGFVGGHCIGVDPYYLIHKAQELNYYMSVIPAARKVNEQVPIFIADETIKFIIKHHQVNNKTMIGVLGITYKENCSDIRNSLVVNLIRELETYGVKTKVYDPLADPKQVKDEYGIKLVEWKDLSNLSAIVIAVSHNEFMKISKKEYQKKLVKNGVMVDVKGILPIDEFKLIGIDVWSF